MRQFYGPMRFFDSFYRKTSMPINFPRFRAGVLVFFGGAEMPIFYLYGADASGHSTGKNQYW